MGEIDIKCLKHLLSCVYIFLFAVCPEKLQYIQVHFKPCCAFGGLGVFLVLLCMSKRHYQYQANLYAILLFFRNKVA